MNGSNRIKQSKQLSRVAISIRERKTDRHLSLTSGAAISIQVSTYKPSTFPLIENEIYIQFGLLRAAMHSNRSCSFVRKCASHKKTTIYMKTQKGIRE